jgi:hypothetical protein
VKLTRTSSRCQALKVFDHRSWNRCSVRRYVARIYWCHDTALSKEAVVAQVAKELCQEGNANLATTAELPSRLLQTDSRAGYAIGQRLCSDSSSDSDADVRTGFSGSDHKTSGSHANGHFKADVGSPESGPIREGFRPDPTKLTSAAVASPESANDPEDGLDSPRDPPNGGLEKQAEVTNGVKSVISDASKVELVKGGKRGVKLRIQACPKSLEAFFTDNLPGVDVGMVSMKLRQRRQADLI